VRTLNHCFFALLTLVLSVGPLRPQDPQTQSDIASAKVSSPYLWVRSDEPGVDALPLKSTSVHARISGVIAEVTVTQVYQNEGSKPLEAVYVFPGSTRAAIHAMTMKVGERILKAEIRERGAARREYATARLEGRTASLLEQERPNLFQMQVANILPGDKIQVEMTYSELLVPKEGEYAFVYPTVAGPRYTKGSVDGAVSGAPYVPDASKAGSSFNMNVTLDAGMSIGELRSDSHSIEPTWTTRDHVCVSLKSSDSPQNNRDFILTYRLAGDQIQSGLMLTRTGGENFFLLMMQPPKRLIPEAVPPQEFIFILDVSGSMYGYPLDTAKELMKNLVGGLRNGDRFNIVTFAAGQQVWAPSGSLPSTAANRLKAWDFVDAQKGKGGSEILNAFKTAFALPRERDQARTVVLLSDGYVNVEPKILDLIRENLGGTNVFAFGIGSSVNRYLMEGIAHVGQGESFVVTNAADAGKEASRFRKYIAAPMLSCIRLKFDGFDAFDTEPMNVPDVLSDRPIICFGKWRGEAKGNIEVTGLTGIGTYTKIIPVADAKQDGETSALRHLWARHRIQMLGDYGLLGGVVNQAEITRLGLAYELMTEYTAFVAVDKEIRNPGTPTIQVPHPNPLPAGSREEPVLMTMPRYSREIIACLSPGVSTSASATVTVSASTAHYDSSATCCATMDFSEEEIIRAPEVRKVEKQVRRRAGNSSFQIGKLSADREGVPLLRTAALVEQKMKDIAKAGLFKDLPETFNLQLRVDASGAVTAVIFDRACGGPGKLLEARLLAWRFETWTMSGTTVLHVPVHVNR
jgi:Ca-activated chloride channel family protein